MLENLTQGMRTIVSYNWNGGLSEKFGPILYFLVNSVSLRKIRAEIQGRSLKQIMVNCCLLTFRLMLRYLFFFILHYNFLCVRVLLSITTSMYFIYAVPCEFKKKSLATPGTGTKDGCELPCGYWE